MRPDDGVVCIRCGQWYPATVGRCPDDGTPLVRPETLTELVEEVDTNVETDAETICARCGRRLPPDVHRCPYDGTPLVLPQTLVELMMPARSGRSAGSRTLACMRCGRQFSSGERRCPDDGTPLVEGSISAGVVEVVSPLSLEPTTTDGPDEESIHSLATADDLDEVLAGLPPTSQVAQLPVTASDPMVPLDDLRSSAVLAVLPSEEVVLEQADPPEPAEPTARPRRSGRARLIVAGLAALLMLAAITVALLIMGDGAVERASPLRLPPPDLTPPVLVEDVQEDAARVTVVLPDVGPDPDSSRPITNRRVSPRRSRKRNHLKSTISPEAIKDPYARPR